MKNVTKKTRLRPYLPFIGILVFAAILIRIGLRDLFEALISVKPLFLAGASMLTPIYILLQCFRWQTILKRQGIEGPTLPQLFVIQVKGIFYGIISPARIGTFAKILFLQEHTPAPSAKILSGIITDRMLDAVILLLLASLGTGVLWNTSRFMAPATFMLLGAIILLWILPKKKLWKTLFGKLFYAVIPDRYKNIIREHFNQFFAAIPTPRVLALPALLSLINWYLIYTQGFIIAKAFGIHIPYTEFLILMPLSTAVSLLPITIAGLGTKELALLYLFSTYPVPEASTVSFSLTVTALYFLTILILFIVTQLPYGMQKRPAAGGALR